MNERCPNNNHSRSNVKVRYCPSCGEVVNSNVSSGACTTEQHSKRRKERDKFCVDCGKVLRV